MRREDRAGLELTIIVHLVVFIVLLLFGIGFELQNENSFVLDFTKQEEVERLQEEEQLQQSISDKIEDMLKQAGAAPAVRNIATGGRLRDDRNSASDADKLYKDAERLAKELRNGYKSDIEEDAKEDAVDYKSEPEREARQYSGPSVLSWTLDGRKASHLPIPADRCYGAGQVTVNIVVDQQGNVVNAKINDSLSESDRCLRDFAVRAARLSKYHKDPKAPARQAGEIVYSFIAQ